MIKRIQDIAILSDNQTAIKALNSSVISSKMVWDCLHKLKDLGKNSKVTLVRMPGYIGLEWNEHKDKLA